MVSVSANNRYTMRLAHWLTVFCFNSQSPEGGCRDWVETLVILQGFNSQPLEGGCGRIMQTGISACRFQLTAARRRLPVARLLAALFFLFQLTAARRRLPMPLPPDLSPELVSTHSRPKAAAESSMVLKSSEKFQLTAARRRLHPAFAVALFLSTFQLTAARRRLQEHIRAVVAHREVSTHSRPKAAAGHHAHVRPRHRVSTHSRPKAAAGYMAFILAEAEFQLTAARRRLPECYHAVYALLSVSTHSRPKAAAFIK